MSDSYEGFRPLPQVPQGIDRDWPGPQPRQEYAAGERERFEAIRAELDRPLQAAQIKPSMPQAGHTPQSYERDLLRELSTHTRQYSALKTSTSPVLRQPRLLDQYKDEIVAEAMDEPRRRGELRPVVTKDRAGREITEFIGAKVWLDAFRAPVFESPIFVDGKPRRAPTIL